MDSESKEERILIRGTNWIGDAVMTLPAIRAVRHALPDAHITLLVKPWVSDIFRGNPDIDEIMLYGDDCQGIVGKLKLAWMIRKKKFETAILFQNAFDAALITWLARIPERIGYLKDMRGKLLTHGVPVDMHTQDRHQIYYYLNLVKSIGIKTEDTHPHIYISDVEREDARSILSPSPVTGHPAPYGTGSNSSPLIGINPGATYGSAKRWPTKNFADLIDRATSELNGRVVLFGGRAEIAIAHEIMQIIQNPSHVLNIAGKTSLRELAALISQCNVFVTNDSGPMHMAYALNVPTVAIFGSTDSTATGPVGEGHKVVKGNIDCSPCLKRECPEGHLRCMTGVTTEEVLSVLKEIVPGEKAVFLDKDGTLIKDMNYLNSFERLEILPGAKEGLKRLKKAGFKLIGITNQSGIARGLVDENFVRESNAHLQQELGIDDFFYCPHHPDEKCQCRKPETLLLNKAGLRHSINLKESYMIGDRESDVLMAKRGGAKGILLSSAAQPEITSASYIAKELDDAVEWILKTTRNK